MQTSTVSLGLIQTSAFSNPADNVAHTMERIRAAAAGGAQVICTQELFTTEYFCRTQNPQYFDLAESIPGPTTDSLCALASELRVVIVASLFEKRARGLYYNSAAIIDADGTLLGIYRKMHIPQDPGFEEKFYFTPGDLGFRVWQTRYAKLGVLICWDQWYPEAARLTALQGADILLYPTAIGWLPEEKPTLGAAQHNAWESVQRGHAVANGLYVAAINRIGFEGDTEFWGQSFIANPYGEILAKASSDNAENLIATLDLDALEDFRRIWPFYRDRRVDAYGQLTQRSIDTKT